MIYVCKQALSKSNFEELVRSTVAASITTFLPENIMIVTNAGGPAVVLTDEIASAGIPLANLSPATTQALKADLPALKISNPLDLLGDPHLPIIKQPSLSFHGIYQLTQLQLSSPSKQSQIWMASHALSHALTASFYYLRVLQVGMS
jgi:hypothetical protein